jgi:hypothetical protein
MPPQSQLPSLLQLLVQPSWIWQTTMLTTLVLPLQEV